MQGKRGNDTPYSLARKAKDAAILADFRAMKANGDWNIAMRLCAKYCYAAPACIYRAMRRAEAEERRAEGNNNNQTIQR